MKNKFMAFVLLIGAMLFGFCREGAAAAVPITDMYPEELIGVCMDKLSEGGSGIRLSSPINDEAFSNIEGMDAWASAVIREPGKLVLTLQTDREAGDRVMAAIMTVSFDDSIPDSDVAANMVLANDFLPVLTSAIGMSEFEHKLLFKHDFSKVPQGALWIPSINKNIVYQVAVSQESKDVYFWLIASDVKEGEGPIYKGIGEIENQPEEVQADVDS